MKRQVAGFFMTPEWVQKPELAEPYIKRMAEDGYSAAIMFWRYLERNLLCGEPEIYESIKTISGMIHRYGMKSMLDTDYAWWSRGFCERHPECSLRLYKGEKVKVRSGAFHFTSRRAPVTLLQKTGHQIFDGLEVYVEENGTFRRLKKEEFRYEWQTIGIGFEIKGDLQGISAGELYCFVTVRYSGFPDVASEIYQETQKKVLDLVADCGLDGFGWDEPAKACNNPVYFKSGEAFLKRFAKEYGYDLLEKLPYLAFADDTAEAVKVRLDYYECLNHLNAEVQKKHNDYAEQLAGRKLLFGTHQTWAGLVSDTAAGITDYFNAGKVLTAAWTDGSWECDLHMYTFHIMLADSLRNELGFHDAYYNDWGSAVPAVEDMKFATRYRMLFHVNWFSSWHSDSTDEIINFRMEPLHSESVKCVQALDRLDEMLGEMKTAVEAGIVYSWKSICAAPKWLSRMHFTGIGNTAFSLVDRGIQTNFISEESLAASEWKDGSLICSGRKLQVLILDDCYVMDDACWEIVKKIAAKGFPVIVYGVPPMFTTGGKEIRSEFARLAGVKPFTLGDVAASYSEFTSLPNPGEWELEQYDSLHYVELTDGTAVYDSEGRIMAVKSASGGLIYMTGSDPREDLANLTAGLIRKEDTVYTERAYHSWFSNPDGSEKVLVLSAQGRMADTFLNSARSLNGNFGKLRRKAHEMRCFVRTEKCELQIEGGEWCIIRFRNGSLSEYACDSKTVVKENQ